MQFDKVNATSRLAETFVLNAEVPFAVCPAGPVKISFTAVEVHRMPGAPTAEPSACKNAVYHWLVSLFPMTCAIGIYIYRTLYCGI